MRPARAGAAERRLGTPYERVPVDIFNGETLTDAFGAMNPARGTRLLEHDGVLDSRLDGRAWVALDAPTIADIASFG
jgi:glutathione S-transferase